MNKGELIEELTDDIISYVMHGEFPEDDLATNIKPDELDERFEDYELLMDLHFILKPEVVNFVERLPKRIRGIKTQTKNVSRIHRGSVEGRINWSSTIKERYSGNPGDHSLFVCDNRTEHYDIDENIVLKKLLSIIYNTLEEAEEYLKKDYKWVNERWKKEQNLIEEMKRIFERDVHVKRIKKPEEYEPTDRMLNTAEKSRQEIYRDAAELISTRERIFDGDKQELGELLNETAITPDDQETLLELFVLFRMIDTLGNIRNEKFELKTISSGKQEVAKMVDGDKEIRLYHDSSVSTPEIKFKSDVQDKDENGLDRTEMVQKKAHETIKNYFIQDDFENHTGRPDVIVLEIIKGEEKPKYLVTEVKNSTSKKTIRQGVKETLEYLAFMQINKKHANNRDQKFIGSGWNGLLVHQDLEEKETEKLESQKNIRILEAKKLKKKETSLEKILERLLQ